MAYFNVRRLLAVVVALLPIHAVACVLPAPEVRLPDEGDEAYAARNRASAEAQDSYSMLRHQQKLFKDAASVILARVGTKTPVTITNSGFPATGYRVKAEPVVTLRGGMPLEPQVIEDRYVTPCGVTGGGQATIEPEGAWFILFVGVRDHKNEARNLGYPLATIRDPQIIDAIRSAAVSLRDNPPTKEGKQ